MNQLSGYCEVKVMDRLIPCKFGMNAFAMFTQMQGIELDQIDKALSTSNVESIRNLIYCGMKSAALSKGIEIDFNEFTVGDWIDDMEESELSKIVETIGNSRVLGHQLGGAKKKETP